MKFKTDELKAMLYDESDSLTVVQDTIVDNTRWSIHREVIFEDIPTNRYYVTYYSVGSTEYQDEEPFEYDGAEKKVQQVFFKSVEVMAFVDKNDNIVALEQ